MCLDNLRSYDKELSLLLEEIHLLLFEKDVFNYAYVCVSVWDLCCVQVPLEARGIGSPWMLATKLRSSAGGS